MAVEKMSKTDDVQTIMLFHERSHKFRVDFFDSGAVILWANQSVVFRKTQKGVDAIPLIRSLVIAHVSQHSEELDVTGLLFVPLINAPAIPAGVKGSLTYEFSVYPITPLNSIHCNLQDTTIEAFLAAIKGQLTGNYEFL